jgi:chaperonin GroES
MIKLLGSKILVKPEDTEKMTASGLVLPDNVTASKARAGIVVAIGTGDRNDKGDKVPMEVTVGDKVLYNHSDYGTSELEVEGVKHYIIEEREVIGIL